MSKDRLSVVVTRRLPSEVETRLSELFDVTLRNDNAAMSRNEIVEAMKTADVLVPTITDTIDAAMLGQAGERLKLIANYGAGVDNIDVATARQRGILVSNTPGVLTEDTADMTMGLILAVTRRLPEGLAAMQAGQWDGWSPTAFLGGRIAGRRHRHKITIRHKTPAIRKSEARGIPNQAPTFWIFGTKGGKIDPLKHP